MFCHCRFGPVGSAAFLYALEILRELKDIKQAQTSYLVGPISIHAYSFCAIHTSEQADVAAVPKLCINPNISAALQIRILRLVLCCCRSSPGSSSCLLCSMASLEFLSQRGSKGERVRETKDVENRCCGSIRGAGIDC